MRTRRLLTAAMLAAWAAMIVACAGGPPAGAKAEGDTVTFPVTLRSSSIGDITDTTAFEMAQQVWEAAKAHPNAKKCVVKVTMSKQGVEDKYGKAWEKDEEMGEVVIGNLDEVRKYQEAGVYAVNDRVKSQYKSQIRALKYSNLLGVK